MIYLVTCKIKDCPINQVPYGFPDKAGAVEQKKLHSKNHMDKPGSVEIKEYDEWLRTK